MGKLLLNPGPTNTRFRTKLAQWFGSDVCHRTDEFDKILSDTKSILLKGFKNYYAAIIGGSGTTAMEAMISSLADNITVINAGIYGQRAIDMMDIYDIKYKEIKCTSINDLKSNKKIKNLYFVENETTTGEKFDVNKISKLYPNARLFIDTTSAFGASDYSAANISAMCFCSNKCLQSTPGLGIVIFNKDLKIKKRSYYLNLEKYIGDDIPFTLPVQSVYALNKTLKISKNNKDSFDSRRDRLIKEFEKLGIICINENPSNSIIGFIHPKMNYEKLRDFLLNENIVIYAGIKGIKNSFRISTMSTKFDKNFNRIIGLFHETCLF